MFVSIWIRKNKDCKAASSRKSMYSKYLKFNLIGPSYCHRMEYVDTL